MIFSDKVIVITGGGLDPKGNPIPETENGPYPGNVQPLRSSVRVQHGGPTDTDYVRVYIGRTGGQLLEDGATKVKWRNTTFDLQGAVEPWIVGGRLDHYEATAAHF